jgi:integrase
VRVLRSTIDGHLVPHFGDTPVGQIGKADILALRNKLAEVPGRAAKGLSAKRINGILAPLKQMLAEAAEMHGFTSPAVNIKPLRVKKSDVQPFTLAEVQSLIGRARADYRHYFIVRFFTGMRTGEVHGLKWKYVDFERRLILVRETFVLGEDEYTKTDSSQRDIQMSQVVFEALRQQHAATAKLSDYVFCNRAGEPLDNKNFSDRVWYPLLRHLGLPARRPYQMRHTAATLWLASGEAPEWIARQLGHASTEMLFRVYSRYVPNLTRRDGSAIDRLLASRFAGISEVAPGAPQLPPPDEQPPPVNAGTWALAA